ncbi:MAG: repC [Hyphomicrobiales bacterium]|nr:repC [Hyphomicrobiales bacterium]
MEPHLSTTPFGRRRLTLAHVAGQAVAKARSPDMAVHKWNVFRAICTAKARIGVSERALAVLDALLTFHPETALTGDELIVWPSNHQLSLRAHGMAPATLRRHLASLVDGGLIVRRDSPNGKRYARKGRGGEVELAFGFDLAPIVVRAAEFEAWAEEVRAQDRALKLVRERITICRRDVAKMIAMGIEEGLPTRRNGHGPADWAEIHALYRSIVERIPRTATCAALEPIAEELSLLAEEVHSLLELHVNETNPSGNESQSERHVQNSNPDYLTDLEPSLPIRLGGRDERQPASKKMPEGSYPLGMILDACPDISDYAKGGHPISNWRDFLATVAVVRPMLGISPSAWEEARGVMGEVQAAVVVACILQRATAINSAGGYIRGLTRRAEAGEFSLGPMLMALIGSRNRGKLRA